MQVLSQFRDAERVKPMLDAIRRLVTKQWTIMEICGGQTHAIMHYGLHELLPAEVELVHGPGCPVCVTPLELVDKALAIASRPEVIFTTFGDMLRVPGSNLDLFSIKAAGGNVRVVYSPLDAVKIAQQNPDKQVVFFAIGFETTAPVNIMSVVQARALKLKNFSILTSLVRVPPAMHAILGSPFNRVQGFLAAGHVCAVMGYWEYPSIASLYHVPMAVTGFEPLDLVQGIYSTIELLEKGSDEVVNAYSRVVTFEGNRPAQKMLDQYLEPCDRQWRGIGMIPMSGWRLRDEFSEFDAEKRFDVSDIHTHESEICIAGQVLQGLKKPFECPAFGTLCTPDNPLGATMVSSEGTCAAYFRYYKRS
ncbi:MAG: hydrogenase formation protein HypD [Anaerolineae bacterium]|nr:hydrogenase formation protein HypD [Anaerolineae bacterium]